MKLFLWTLASLQGNLPFLTAGTARGTGKGNDGRGAGLVQGLLCAHLSPPEGSVGVLEPPQLQEIEGCPAGCSQEDDFLGKEEFPPRKKFHFPAPHRSVPLLLQSPSSPTVQGWAFLPGFWEFSQRGCGERQREQGKSEATLGCRHEGDPWGQGGFWGCLKGISAGKSPCSAWAAPVGKNLMESGSFYPIKSRLGRRLQDKPSVRAAASLWPPLKSFSLCLAGISWFPTGAHCLLSCPWRSLALYIHSQGFFPP